MGLDQEDDKPVGEHSLGESKSNASSKYFIQVFP
jgi:hypothetical protein